MIRKILHRLLNGKQTNYTLLCLSIHTFTNESHLGQIQRQGRLQDYMI
jgi:hypothetical protein